MKKDNVSYDSFVVFDKLAHNVAIVHWPRDQELTGVGGERELVRHLTGDFEDAATPIANSLNGYEFSTNGQMPWLGRFGPIPADKVAEVKALIEAAPGIDLANSTEITTNVCSFEAMLAEITGDDIDTVRKNLADADAEDDPFAVGEDDESQRG